VQVGFTFLFKFFRSIFCCFFVFIFAVFAVLFVRYCCPIFVIFVVVSETELERAPTSRPIQLVCYKIGILSVVLQKHQLLLTLPHKDANRPVFLEDCFR